MSNLTIICVSAAIDFESYWVASFYAELSGLEAPVKSAPGRQSRSARNCIYLDPPTHRFRSQYTVVVPYTADPLGETHCSYIIAVLGESDTDIIPDAIDNHLKSVEG